MKTCKTCDYWFKEHKKKGECHRDSPMIYNISDSICTFWPKTRSSNGCGQWTEQEKKEDKKSHHIGFN
jgi:hypothetical protein